MREINERMATIEDILLFLLVKERAKLIQFKKQQAQRPAIQQDIKLASAIASEILMIEEFCRLIQAEQTLEQEILSTPPTIEVLENGKDKN